MASGAAPAIETRDLTKTFGTTQALSALNLKVQRHSIFGFLGPNGAGKTTTIKLLLGLDRATRGTVSVFGLDSVANTVEVRRKVGYLAQDPRYYEHMTAREILEFTARFFYSGPKGAIRDRAQEMLDLVGLSDRADRPIRGFSGGERQRLGIAQAQVNYPDLLILDEPAASLDPMGRHDVLELMERLREHTTIFYSTHILQDVQRVSDTVAILNHGQLVTEGPIEELLRGREGITYILKVKGDPSAAEAILRAQPWVLSLKTSREDGLTTWSVAVNDEHEAEWNLLPIALEGRKVAVTEFTRARQNLEDVFLAAVGASNDAAGAGHNGAAGAGHEEMRA